MSKAQPIILVIVVTAGWIFFASGAPNLAQGTPDAKTRRVAEPTPDLEYKVVSFSGFHGLEDEFTARLNELAQDGWRYAFVVTKFTIEKGKDGRRTKTYIAFQRPK